MIETPIRRQLSFFWKTYKTQILIGAIAILLIDIAELYLPILLRDTVDAFSSGVGLAARQKSLVQGLLLVVGLQVVGRYVWRVALSKSAMLAGAEFRKQFSSKSFKISIPTMEKKKVGDLMTLATGDVENMRFMLGPGLIMMIDSIFYCIALPLVMYFIAPGLMWKVMLPTICIPFVVLAFEGKISAQSKRVQEQIGKLGTLTQEMISGVRIIKTYGLENKVRDKLNDASHTLNERQVELTQTQTQIEPAMEFFLSASIVILFSSTGYSIGTLVAMQRYVQKLLWPLGAAAMAVIYFQKGKASGRDFFDYADEPDVESDVSVTKSLDLKKGVPLIEARNLSFGFESGKPTIQNLTFAVHEGEWVGISGAVGSGKSTLLQLLMKFYPVERGQLFVNGIDINDYSPDVVRHFFSSVLQDPYLFQGTLIENLDVAPADEMQPLQWSMSVSGMHEEEFGPRMEQKLGERGAGLSGGQKQRVGIARALRKKAPILLLDDPLSSVDMKTAQYVLGQMSSEIRKLHKTVLFVSHHEEHLAHCDRVVKI